MKRIIIPFFCAVVFSVPAMAQKSTAATNVKISKSNLTSKQILDNYYQALGGKTKLENVKSVIIESSLKVDNTEINTISKRMGNKLKNVTISKIGEATEVFNGSTGYYTQGKDRKEYATFKISEAKVGKTIEALSLDTPQKYSNVTVEIIGGKRFNVLASKDSKFYFDATTNLLYKTVMGGIEFVIKNYVTEGGIKFPETIETIGYGKSTVLKNNKITLDSGVTEDDFK